MQCRINQHSAIIVNSMLIFLLSFLKILSPLSLTILTLEDRIRMITPMPQTRLLMPREVKRHCQGHTAGESADRKREVG